MWHVLQRKTGKDSDTAPLHIGHWASPKQHVLQTHTCPHGRSITHPTTSAPPSKHTTHSRSLSTVTTLTSSGSASAPLRTSSSSGMRDTSSDGFRQFSLFSQLIMHTDSDIQTDRQTDRHARIHTYIHSYLRSLNSVYIAE